jgi:uncharacterized Zn finger protein
VTEDFTAPDGRQLRGKALAKIRDKMHGCPQCDGKKQFLEVYKKGLIGGRYTFRCSKCGFMVTEESFQKTRDKWNYAIIKKDAKDTERIRVR